MRRRHHWSKTSTLADTAFVIVQVSAPYKKTGRIYRVKAKLGGHGYRPTGAPDVAIPLFYAVPMQTW